MTDVTLTRNGVAIEIPSPLPWDQVVEVVGRAFWPDGPCIGGPALPAAEQPKERR